MASHTTKKASKGRNNKEKNDSSKLVTNDSSLKTDDLFYCTDCGMGFDNPQALGGHRSQHSRGRVYLNTDISTQKKVRLGEMIAPPLHQQSNSSKRKKHSDESSEIPNPLRARALLSPPTKKRRLVPPNPEPIIVSEINQPEPEKRESDEPPHIVIKNLKHDIAEIEQRKESIGREIKLLSKMLSRLQSLGVFELSHNPQLYFGQHKKQRKIVKSTVIEDSNNDNNSNSETISSIDSQTSTVISKQHSSNHIQNLELIRVNTKNINDQETVLSGSQEEPVTREFFSFNNISIPIPPVSVSRYDCILSQVTKEVTEREKLVCEEEIKSLQQQLLQLKQGH